MRILWTLPLCAAAWGAVSVRETSLGLEASGSACAISYPVARVATTARQVYARVVVEGISRGDSLLIEWVDPRGGVAATAPYESLPAVRSLCLLSQLPVAGFAAGQQPGTWRLRVSSGSRSLSERTFDLVAPASAARLAIHSVERRTLESDETELTVQAWGFGSETSVNLAQYTRADGWRYLSPLLPEKVDGNRFSVRVPKLTPAEYLVILRNPDGTVSPPARFVIETGARYQAPYAADETWRITQGPYGSFSHHGNAVHAYDLAPTHGRLVRAMRAGVVRAHDLGLGQTPQRRIFGNYITLDHGDGEYSHYAHLRTGTFLVRTGERVEAGQPLAAVGTSGYSFGVHLHVQVSRSAPISSPSIPFRFGAAASPAGKLTKGKPAPAPVLSKWDDRLTLAAWWTRLCTVPKGAPAVEFKLDHDDPGHEFELYVTSPSGRQYPPEGPQRRIERPEPGPWRVTVQAVKGDADSLPFSVEVTRAR